jgi:2,3-bisphosphoglycerate-dependent phosphoglycerate mutase
MRIFIIRHSQSEATVDPTLFGRMDPKQIPLTNMGHLQAVVAGKAIKELYNADNHGQAPKLVVYYTSHLRIAQSKDGFLEGVDGIPVIAVHEEPRIAERDHGDFDGLDEKMQKEKNPEIFTLLHEGGFHQRFTTKMPNGESLEDVHNRIKDFVASLKDSVDADTDVVVITHGANCRALERALTHYDATWLEDTRSCSQNT